MSSSSTFKFYILGGAVIVIALLLVMMNRNRVYTRVDHGPMFPGGFEAFENFVAANIQYPADDARAGTEGKAIVQFVVEKDGTLTDIKVIRAPTAAMGKEAVRVLSLSPRWQPGRQNNAPVRVSYIVPISFSLH